MHDRASDRMRARLRVALAIVVVAAATIFGGLIALWSFSVERRLSAGTVSLSVSPFHQGALDLYVPLVDWGVRFPGVHIPARLKVEVQAINRGAASQIARDVNAIAPLRHQARDAIASYLELLAVLAAVAALALGCLVTFALRPLRWVRARWLFATTGVFAIAWVAAIAFLLAPRGNLENPSYYAHGEDIPVALQAVESVARTPGSVSASFEEEISGLARLVIAPGRRPSLTGLPRLTIASDMHNNVLFVSALRSAAAGSPVLFPGDLTDRGTPLETSVLRTVVSTGHPFLFTAGNHDSDTLSQSLADDGAIVLTKRGRLLRNGHHGPLVVDVDGLRIAGYQSPNERLVRNGYADNGADITTADETAFAAWLAPLRDKVDIVMVHEPALVDPLLPGLRAERGHRPLLFVVGHTHHPAVDSADGITLVNGGTIGAGGIGNLLEHQNASLAIVTYQGDPFAPLATDLVTLDPGTGETTARRVRLGDGPVQAGDLDTAAPPGTG